MEDLVYAWNNRFTIDRWWRQKHKVAFNSSQHREMSFIDMKFEYIEDRLVEKEMKKHDKDESDINEYIPGTHDYLKPRTFNYSEKEIDKAYDSLDDIKLG